LKQENLISKPLCHLNLPGNEAGCAAAFFGGKIVSLVFTYFRTCKTKKMELSSPPKPTRIVDCLLPDAAEGTASPQASKTTRRSDVVGGQAGEASQMEAASLPALAGEVAIAQKQQISELSKKQEILEQLKVS